MGLNHLQSLICTYSADDLRPLMINRLKSFRRQRNGCGASLMMRVLQAKNEWRKRKSVPLQRLPPPPPSQNSMRNGLKVKEVSSAFLVFSSFFSVILCK